MSTLSRHWRGETYYGRASLKPAPWKWYVSAYIGASGLAGGAQLLATCAWLADRHGTRPLVRNARILAATGAAAGAVLLIADLGTPARWYNMLRIFRATSPMSIGTYILSAFGAATGATIVAELPLGRAAAAFGAVGQIPAGIAGAGLGTYTASLLSATSAPGWAAAPRALAVEFATESVATAAAALAIGERLGGRKASADRLDTVAAIASVTHLAASAIGDRRARDKGVAAVARTRPGRNRQLANMVVAGALPLAAHLAYRRGGRRDPTLPLIGAAAILAGGFLSRAATVRVGQRSAERPRDAFRFAQPANLPEQRP